jgi:hypothetical protein
VRINELWRRLTAHAGWALALTALVLIGAFSENRDKSTTQRSSPPIDQAPAVALRDVDDDPMDALARSDPRGLVQCAIERYDRSVHDYRCTFLKQELLEDGLTPVQRVRVLFRQSPLSVFMIWEENADRVKRALFIDAPEFVDAKGRKTAKVEPAGCLARAFVAETMRPIHSSEARQNSRRSIDEFGFRSTLGLLERYNREAERRGVLDFRYVGEAQIDKRSTYLFRRFLPYTGAESGYPDARLDIHIDQEWLLPTAVYSYADARGEHLLGSYVLTNVELNAGLSDRDFKF